MEKLLEPGKFNAALVRLVGGEEREDRELVGILEQAQSLVVIFVAGRHQAFGVRVVVIDLLVLGESTVVQPPVLEQVVGLVPQFSGDFFLDLVGDGPASSRRWRYRQQPCMPEQPR